jgi:hypothetical protein
VSDALLFLAFEIGHRASAETDAAIALVDEAEQQMLGADVVIPQAQRLAQRELKHPFGARRERDLTRGGSLARSDDLHPHLIAHCLDGDVKRTKDASGDALFFTQQAEQKVLGADVVMVKCPRLFLGQDDHQAGALGKSLKHTRRIPPSRPPATPAPHRCGSSQPGT